MRFEETRLLGAYVLDLEPIRDDRGFFARSFCAREFEEHGLQPVVAQCNVSFNASKGTVRGLHFAVEPGAEAKLVRCTRGAIWDAIVEETFPIEALTDPKVFYDAGDDDELKANADRMLESCRRFLDFEPMEWTHMSEYCLG